MKKNITKNTTKIMATMFAACVLTVGCSSNDSSDAKDNSTSTEKEEQTSETQASADTDSASYTGNASGIIDTSDLFSDRDLEQTADTSDAESKTVADGQTIEIKEEGVYVISGSAKNCTIKVEADEEAKVQLVLDGVSITNDDFPAIYVVSADKCFVTTTDSESTLSVTGTFTADGDTNTDAVIYAKDDLVLNGKGTLNITSKSGNGISGKDDLKVTGGNYVIESADDSFEANESIGIIDGDFQITSDKDGLNCGDSDDDTVGWIYIGGGSFDITAASDGIQGTTAVQIDDGTVNITASEGIEGTYIQINGGTVNVDAADDGINASAKSSVYSTPTIEFSGGNTTIVMGQGDTDAIDANGDIIVNDGTIDVTAPTSSFDYDGTAQFNGGTIIINGSEVTEIPEPMMGGGGGGGRGGAGGGMRR